MLSEIVCGGVRQKLRTTKGGTMATHATAIQFRMDVIPITIATSRTAIDQPAYIKVLVFSENMITSVDRRNWTALFRIARLAETDQLDV